MGGRMPSGNRGAFPFLPRFWRGSWGGGCGRRPPPLTQATGVAPTLRPEAPVSEADW